MLTGRTTLTSIREFSGALSTGTSCSSSRSLTPNVLGIANKLERPQQRKLATATKFWGLVLDRKPGLQCIYTGRPLREAYSIDHFIPWSYVTHDELWNLTPTPREINSSKGNALPDFGRYLPAMIAQQHEALRLIF